MIFKEKDPAEVEAALKAMVSSAAPDDCEGPFKKYVTPEGEGAGQMGCDKV